jgi:hypothetical protein
MTLFKFEKFFERNVSRNLTIVKETVEFRINIHYILIEEELLKKWRGRVDYWQWRAKVRAVYYHGAVFHTFIWAKHVLSQPPTLFLSYQRLLPTDWLETAKWATKESAYIRVWKVQAISMVTANCWFITNDTIKTLTSWSRGHHSCFVFGRSQVHIRVLSRFRQMLG